MESNSAKGVDETPTDGVVSGETKSWREGMEVRQGDDANAKTVFISQRLNEEYERRERTLRTPPSYELSVAKIVRQVGYFEAMLRRVGEDLESAEDADADVERIKRQRRVVDEELQRLKASVDAFVAKRLTGEPNRKPRPARKDVELAPAEFAFLATDKKPTGGAAALNLCSDCDVEIAPLEGQDLEAALVAHSQTDLHRASMPEPPPPRISKKDAQTTATVADPKAMENLKKSQILKLNRVTPCLVDDNMTCEVCDVALSPNVQEVFKHMGEPTHRDRLNAHNAGLQKEIVERNPDAFGDGGQFQLTTQLTDLHKIFVDPSIKLAYCGLCSRQLPFSQGNIDEHVNSLRHDKLLVEAVDGSLAEFAALGIDPAVLASIRTRAESKKETPAPQPQQQHQQQQQPLQRDTQIFLDVADIQNFRKVLPDKPIRSIPELLDSNNVPIHNLEHYEQPDLKRFLNENGMTRQPGGKFKCQYCPTLEIPNSRYAYRHVNKHRTGAANAQCFENWKRQPNRQQGYANEQKLGRVVMHKNGVNYWCTSCRLPLIDASTAFAHVKTENHHMFVDGVSFSSGTIFDCVTCKTTINGEKNACQHLIAAKHRENSKMEALVKQEGRMNMIEERKQKQKANEAQRRERMEYNANNATSEEERMLDKNGIVYSPELGIYQCGSCGWSSKKRSDMVSHVFSYEHTTSMAKQGR